MQIDICGIKDLSIEKYWKDRYTGYRFALAYSGFGARIKVVAPGEDRKFDYYMTNTESHTLLEPVLGKVFEKWSEFR